MWQWIAIGLALWLILSVVTGVLWATVARGLRRARRRNDRRRPGLS